MRHLFKAGSENLLKHNTRTVFINFGKTTQKNPLPFTHHRTSLTTHPTASSTPSTTSTTNTAPNTSTMKTAANTKISTTATQSTSNTPMQNFPTTPTTPTHATLTTITTTTMSTTTPITSITTITTIATTTTTTTQTQIPSLMDLDIPLPLRLCTPSLSLTIPLASSPPHSVIFPRTLQELQQSGLWGTLVPDEQQRPKEVTITWRF